MPAKYDLDNIDDIDSLFSKPEVHPKGWGKELWIANTPLYCSKILVLNQGKQCSIHFHKLKDETFYILSGKVRMDLYPDGYIPKSPVSASERIMEEGDTLHILPGLIHRFYGLEYSRILEVSTQHFEDDSYRLLRGD